MSKKDLEIEILNFEDLDVEELEERLETAVAGGMTPDAWIYCDCDGIDCGVQCSGNCGANCGAACGADTCETNGCGGGHLIP